MVRSEEGGKIRKYARRRSLGKGISPRRVAIA